MLKSRNAREGKFQTIRNGVAYRGSCPVGPNDLSFKWNRKGRKEMARCYPNAGLRARKLSLKEQATLAKNPMGGFDVPDWHWSATC